MITAISNGRLLDSIGDEPVENGSVVIEDGVIKEVYSGKKSIPNGATVIDAGGRTIMPGLIDGHDHVAGTELNPEKRRTEPPLYKALKMQGNLERLLQAGFTTVRSMGGCHWSLKQAVEDGLVKGPRLLIACSYMSPTGGHGDPNLHGEQLFYDDLDRLVQKVRICDGESECRKAAREVFRSGADHMKIFATGGCASPNDEPWHRQFCDVEIRAIVEEAESVGLYVSAHCQEDLGQRAAVECGVRTVEHGPFMSKETAELMKERDVFFIPTLAVTWWIMKYGPELGAAESFMRKVREPRGPGQPDSLEAQMISVRLALEVGVPIGSGADYICSQMIGGEAMELKLKVEAGMTPYQAIKSATVVNSQICRMENVLGSIEAGKWADIIVVDGKPDENIDVLVEPSNVELVMKKGGIFKNLL